MRKIVSIIVIFVLSINIHANEQPLNLEIVKPDTDKIYVPPGSAIKYLGELFVQLKINGGIHIGPSFTKTMDKWDKFDKKRYKARGSRPGDPDYCIEFLTKADSVKGALDRYCKGKNIFWEVKDNTVNMFTGDVLPGKENILDIPLGTIKIQEYFTLWDVMGAIAIAIKKNHEKEIDISESRNAPLRDAMRSVLPDYRDVIDNNFFITRTYIFKDKSARYILNTLLKPFPDIIWVLIETDSRTWFTVGSWHPKLQEVSAEVIIEKYIRKTIIVECKKITYDLKKIEETDSYFFYGFDSPRFKEALMALYAYYKKDPEDIVDAIDKEIKKPNGNSEFQYPKTKEEIKAWKDLKKFIQKPFDEFETILY